jgi:hypothetical protein
MHPNAVQATEYVYCFRRLAQCDPSNADTCALRLACAKAMRQYNYDYGNCSRESLAKPR